MTEDERPIALEAYEKLAEAYSAMAEAKAENGFIEHPAMRQQLGTVRGLRVLDAGCGPGILSRHLVQAGAQVTAFDISPKMLELAAARTEGKVELHLADMSKPLPFLKSEAFDIVASSLAIDYVRDWSVPLSEFYRALKPGGRLVFTVQHPVGAYLWYKLDGYAGLQYVESVWKGFGTEAVVMPDYYRAIEDVINPVLDAGFRLKRVLDTKPGEALKDKDEKAFRKFSQKPPFLLLEAQK